MFSTKQYQMLDFGGGRKLERFGALILDRPSPAAGDVRRQLDGGAWQQASARFERTEGDRGHWVGSAKLPESWRLDHWLAKFELKPNEFGHLGVFPEQAANWNWIHEQVTGAGRPLKVLNLFAYTGGSTLAAAAAGAEVAHIDAAQNVVNWARRNAEHSRLSDAPIRWIAEDALKFAWREVKRGNQYDGIILDPPSYGHGPKGETWKLEEQLPDLLALCAELTRERRQFILLTCHAPDIGPAEAKEYLISAIGPGDRLEAGTMNLHVTDGRGLPSGVFVRMSVANHATPKRK